MPNLDDPSQTSFYIPYAPESESEPENKLQEACIAAYKTSWTKCLHRLKTSIADLYRPTVSSIAHSIQTAYDDALPGLPYPELPFIAVHNVSALFINAVLAQPPGGVILSHLYPSDAPNIATGMKNLISGFLESNLASAKRKSTRHAAHDISLLSWWYTSLQSEPRLLVVMHDLEQFDSSVMQDLLYICSTRIPQLPLIFLVFLASPPTPSFIQSTYPRTTLSRLRVQSFSVQTGRAVLDHILLPAFFSPSIDSDLMLGPAALAGIVDHYTRHDSSLDALITCVQLVHLKHFLVEPLSLLVHPPSELTTDPAYRPILFFLHSRLPPSTPNEPQALLDILTEHHTTFVTKSRSLRLGLTLLRTLHTFLTFRGYKPLHSHSGHVASTLIAALRGQVTREVKALSTYVRKLRNAEVIQDLLDDLHGVFSSLPSAVRELQEDARTKIALLRSAEPGEVDTAEFGEWLAAYIHNLIQPLEQLPLWDIWYTGSSPFPNELINPSTHASLTAGLLRPFDFTLPIPSPLPQSLPPPITTDPPPPLSPTVSDLQAQLELKIKINEAAEEEDGRNATAAAAAAAAGLHNFPDTSILFRRYLDSGKLINIYDWYESFRAVLDVQREERERVRRLRAKGKRKEKGKEKGRRSRTASPTKKGKGKQKAVVDEEIIEGREEDGAGELDDEAWQREVQARFVRALHELDYLGFVKHTGRRVEHVARVVFDVRDEDEEEGTEEE
ncbi:hypothetical protein P691DRAFT_787904 [Macrolepiota fuliginosa MF-IS2]|uniref:Origin recognition complex subunit 3 winged helix C-terminal domain-containing protein n=1 Tax=Macrolepiota fuliginosa MF-IS2 TaxID=1400762 RepID=A0A9P6C4C4_9AGAR|nr:hypothetical protein P691DRAFT_787904 [Macrolepiota fuliginosa MF-IS2]